jgi:carbon-monoxide dehydrogenase small subunit
MQLELTLNGKLERREIAPHHTLLDVLRDDFNLKGTKGYCHSGVCGACTVLLDGKPISACIMLASQTQGKSITTVEGLAKGENLHPVQRAFVENFGLQCGYCTPGMLLLTVALLEENPEPTKDEIVDYLGGNICRCTGYANILKSVQAAAALTKESSL